MPPDWEHIVEALEQVRGTNVERVAVHTEEIVLDRSGHSHGLLNLAPRVLSHLPNLRSFLLSDYPLSYWAEDDVGRFDGALDVGLQQRRLDMWERGMNKEKAGKWKLERVAFTALFAWERRRYGTWVVDEGAKAPDV
ncbi:hypothetical protein EIP91_004306 [Steccherinum ochraceum]|uniref:Uncharacterized protein n=1 Tax=Steccherinum ochraceum TaxID=92696 RepID=A0A4V2MVY8_9APHY|nr:hypothetical protein EIP91_004306 [Steccherinum ochraceum]